MPVDPHLALAESPLARLAVAAAGEAAPFLAPHQLEAGERVRKLAERALLQPRLTMNYSPTHTVSGKAGNPASELGDLAADARRQLNDLHRLLPRDCVDVIMDICVWHKGLQQVETERHWPRRSAKLVLRIGLDHLARHYGLTGEARGRDTGRQRGWMAGERPPMFG